MGTRIVSEKHFCLYTYLYLANHATMTICRDGSIVMEGRPPDSFIAMFRAFCVAPIEPIKRSSSSYGFEFDPFDF